MVTLYNVVSRDGFIARKDGSEDFIPDELWPATLEFFKTYDVLVMGRKTYDALHAYPPELLESFEKLPLKKVVVTRNKDDFHPDPRFGYVVLHSATEVPLMGANVLVSSGPTLNDFLLEKGLVNKVILHQLPDEIGEGIRPFDPKVHQKLTSMNGRELADGVQEAAYEVRN